MRLQLGVLSLISRNDVHHIAEHTWLQLVGKNHGSPHPRVPFLKAGELAGDGLLAAVGQKPPNQGECRLNHGLPVRPAVCERIKGELSRKGSLRLGINPAD